MSDLKQMLKNKFDENRGLLKEVSIEAGLSSSSALTKFLDKPEKELEDFSVLVFIVKRLFPDREYQLITEYSLTLDPKKQCSRQALEYADVNNLNDLTDELIIKLAKSKNSTSNEWAAVYKLHRQMTKGEISVLQANDSLSDISIKSAEMKIFSKVMFLYQYLNKREFKRHEETINYIDTELINNFSSSFIKNSFNCRILIMKGNARLFENDVIETRDCIEKCLKITNTVRFIALGYMNLGNTYMFENYDKARSYFLKGVDACEYNPIYKPLLERSLSFLANYWSKENSYLVEESEDIDDIQEIIFHKISIGQSEEALEMLNSLNKHELTDYDLAYDNYFRGLISKEKSYLYESIKYFKLTGDKFYRNAPLIELKKLGESDHILELFAL
ncbi:AimR family lysis-lysogeny pheromone receptor [Metabacillus arenae]|uniref:Prophage helix-turn-helix protein n=1 Tax=Metabacillus arenae TaxID=2771434 RepID=A0A926NES2_9BACI|nr:AimR family lysis-lysogeny pheromone receptor [Metabacillus arenae]MBD1379138.1 hypothetical protein [Metabacillus arenae]